MAIVNTDNLLIEANKYIQDPDIIIDVYDMTYAWVSDYHCEVTGYTKQEQINMRVAVNSQLVDGDIAHMAPESLHPYEKFNRQVIITTKTGAKQTYETLGIVIKVDDQPFLIGKMIKPVSLSEEASDV